MHLTDSLSKWITPLKTHAPDNLSEGHMVPLSQEILRAAIAGQFSDIHFRPDSTHITVLARRFGELLPWFTLPQSHWPRLAARFKVMAAVNITESRRPQSGRMQIDVDGHKVDIRFSTHPTLQGESMVLRILDARVGLKPLHELGLAPEMVGRVQDFLQAPLGMMVVTGPTGSGKTTFLYALLQQLMGNPTNIMTLEQPIEYQVAGIRQTEVREDLDWDFAQGLRSILRHDPDVILVGEIRDAETAQIALRAAMTGHKVLTTLHTKTCTGIMPRLMDLGAPAYMVKEALQCGVAVRLLPELCTGCREPIAPSEEVRQAYGRVNQAVPDVIYHAPGCDLCAGRGYGGRRLVGDVMAFDGEDEGPHRASSDQPMTTQALALLADGLTDWMGVKAILGGRG